MANLMNWFMSQQFVSGPKEINVILVGKSGNIIKTITDLTAITDEDGNIVNKKESNAIIVI